MKLVYNGHICKLLIHNVPGIRRKAPLLLSYFSSKREFDCQFKSLTGILIELRSGDFRRCSSLALILFLPDNKFLKRMEILFNERDHLKYLTKVLFLGYVDLLRNELIERIESIKQGQRQNGNTMTVRHLGRQYVKISDTNLISIIQQRLNVSDTVSDFVPLLHHISCTYYNGSDFPLQRFITDVNDEYRNRVVTGDEASVDTLVKKDISCHWSTNEPLYLFNINPALGVIINHNTFLTSRPRGGSERDVQSLIEAFERKRMPYIVISDGSAEEVHRCMDLLRDSIMNAFDAIYMFVMSHGKFGDIIKTKTSNYQIDEHIVAPLTSNPSLGKVNLCICVNACRGSYDPRFPSFINKDNPIDTVPSNLPNNLDLVYSTKINRVSLRDKIDGSVFVQQFCEEFNRISRERDMREMVNAIEAKIALKSVFINGTTEYCASPGSQRTVKVMFKNFNALAKAMTYLETEIKDNPESGN